MMGSCLSHRESDVYEARATDAATPTKTQYIFFSARQRRANSGRNPSTVLSVWHTPRLRHQAFMIYSSSACKTFSTPAQFCWPKSLKTFDQSYDLKRRLVGYISFKVGGASNGTTTMVSGCPHSRPTTPYGKPPRLRSRPAGC
jgi:hypothetical protein